MKIEAKAFLADLQKMIDLGLMADLVAEYAVRAFERVVADHPELKGKDKEDALVKLIDGYIKLPAVLDSKPIDADGRVIRAALKQAVDLCNEVKFKRHDWEKTDETTDATATADAVPAVDASGGTD